MREILFRGMSQHTDEWVHGWYQPPIRNYGAAITIIADDGYFEDIRVRPETIGEFTGLLDKKGKKIFEGDIVELESHGYIPTLDRGVVIFKDGCFGIEYQSDVARRFGWEKTFHRIGTISEWRDMGASGTITYTYEVIGNIYDNPELLENGEKHA